MTRRLSGTGVWSSGLRYGDPATAATHAKELEELGYSALWIPDVGGDLFAAVANLLGATSTATVYFFAAIFASPQSVSTP